MERNREGGVEPELLREALWEHFGFDDFRPGQEIALGHLLRGQNTLVVMPTGAGKSLIYQLAALLLPGTTLVISPLISLMKDQTDFLNQRKLPATFINSSLGPAEQNRRLEALAQGDYKLIYVAPERLRSRRFLHSLTSGEVNLLVVDEAHCISEWGHDFRPDYLHIAPTRQLLGNPTIVALTATATPRVQNDIGRELNLTNARRLVTGFNRPNLTLEVRYLPDEKAKLQTLAELVAELRGAEVAPEGGIVYTGTRREAEEVAQFIREIVGLEARHYHAGLDPDMRRAAQEAFLSGDLPVMVATNAFGMGIDRPDVRFVIHYAMPGTLEAYYQEAGRAGRDGLPAWAVLFFAPRDVALQEYFIENDSPTLKELRDLHTYLSSTAPPGPLRITWPELEQATGLPTQKVKVGIQKLESANALHRRADEGPNIVLEVGPLDAAVLNETWAEVLARREQKRAQLAKMQAYAETNQCRRRVILDHFGDHGSPEAPLCCDNCLTRESLPAGPAAEGPLTPSQRAALKVLEAVQTLSFPLGSHKVAQLLTGSRAKGPLRLGLDRHPLYGELEAYRVGEIRALIRRLIGSGHLKQVGGRYPTLGLTAKGEAHLQAGAAIEVELPARDPLAAKRREAQREAQRKAGGSVALTGQLLAQGLRPEQVAARRGLAPSTIYSHLARLIGEGKVEVDAVVPGEVREPIEEAIRSVGSAASLSPLKARLPDHIDYNVIRCVARAWDLKHRQTKAKPPYASPPRAGGPSPQAEEVGAFLARPHPRPLKGPWSHGWALDFHSRFVGAEYVRSQIGELVYRFKYQGERELAAKLARRIAELLGDHPEIPPPEGIVPVPPSSGRTLGPMALVGRALATLLKVPLLTGTLIKARTTQPQKQFRTLAQKHSNVAGAFAVKGPVEGQRLLVLDDLYDSGATLTEVTTVLKRAGAAEVTVLTLTKTIHADL